MLFLLAAQLSRYHKKVSRWILCAATIIYTLSKFTIIYNLFTKLPGSKIDNSLNKLLNKFIVETLA